MSVFDWLAWGVSHVRIRDDSTALNTSGGWLAAENARADGLAADTTYRVRFSVKASVEQSGLPQQLMVQWRQKIEYWWQNWTELTGAGVVRTALSGQYAHGDQCSVQLLTGDEARSFSGEGVGVEGESHTTVFKPWDVVLPEYEIEVAFQMTSGLAAGQPAEIALFCSGEREGQRVLVPGVRASFTRVGAAGSPPVAAFSGSLLEGDAPLEVVFSDESTGIVEEWVWWFGDSGRLERAGQNPVHTYVAPGTYMVGLTVSNAAGSDTETKTGYVVVTAPPVWVPDDPPPEGWDPGETVPEKVWRRAHVGIGALGYVLEPNTYEKRMMPAFTQRFASGTLEYGDLSYWQYLSQDDFRGGEGEEIFDVSAGPQVTYLKGYGVRGMEPDPTLRLCPKPIEHTDVGNVGDAKLIVAWEGAPLLVGTGATVRQWQEADGEWGEPVSFDNAPYVMATDGYPTCATYAPPYVVVGTSNGRLVFLDSDVMRTGVPKGMRTAPEGYRFAVMQILPLSGLLFFVALRGSSLSPWTRLFAVRFPAPGENCSWQSVGLSVDPTVGPQGTTGLPVGNEVGMIWHQGAIWIALNTGFQGLPSRSSTVLAWSNGAEVLGYKSFPGFICKGMASIGARLLLVGNYADRAVIMTDDGVVLKYKSIGEAWDQFTSEFCSVFAHHDHLLIGGSGTVRAWETDGGMSLTEAVFLPPEAYDEWLRVEAIVKAQGRYHLKVRDRANQALMWECGEEDVSETFGEIRLSEIDAGMREVPKIFSSVTVRTKEALSAENVVEVRVGGTLLGQANSGMTTEMFFPASFGVRKTLEVTVRLIAGAEGDPPELTAVTVRYVPLGPYKRVWSFAVKAQNALRMLDGETEKRSGEEIAADLWALANAQLPVWFRDVDGESYVVMILDAIAKCPMPDKPRPVGEGPEFLVALEMVEY